TGRQRGDRAVEPHAGDVRARRQAPSAARAVPRLPRAEPCLRRDLLAELRLGRARRAGLRPRARQPARRPGLEPGGRPRPGPEARWGARLLLADPEPLQRGAALAAPAARGPR